MKKLDFKRNPETLLLLLPFRRDNDPLLQGILVAHIKTATKKAVQLAKTAPPEHRDEILSKSIAIFSIETMPFSFQSN